MTTPSESFLPAPRRVPARLGALLVFALLGALAVWHPMRSQSAIEALPPDARRALYEQTLESLETVCRPHDAQFTDYCRDQAELILRLPECDVTCREVAAPFLRATR